MAATIYLTPNLHKITRTDEKNPDIHTGDLVVLNSHPYVKDNAKNDLYSADPQSIPPAMVVVEVIKNSNKDSIKYDEEIGEIISGSIYKYRCQYYSTKEGKFKEFVLAEQVITKIDTTIQEEKFAKRKKQIRKFTSYQIGKGVELKTFIFEISKQKSSIIYSKKNEDIGNIPRKSLNIKNEKTIVPLLSHLPPSLVVTGIEKNKDTNGIYRTKADGNRETIREVSLYKIKCMWYNPIDCKFSEDWFIPEALISIEEK